LEIGEGAQAEYLSVAGEGAFESVRREAHLAKDARLTWIDACMSPAFSRTAFVTCLEGEGAEVSSISLLIGSGRQRYDVWHEIRHLAPRTVSDLKVRTLLSDDAKAIVRGLVRVEKDAPGCSGFQREETLLLSEYAEIDAIPNLEIENQDVRCGHAATIGRLDEEKLFYLMSRGLDQKSAERLMIDAFVEPFLSAIADESLRASLAETIAAKLA
jgi:Fe-S cluster assembly protein SufD